MGQFFALSLTLQRLWGEAREPTVFTTHHTKVKVLTAYLCLF